jgi:pimeloyl-ACP methyl ester carboxylesterase
VIARVAATIAACLAVVSSSEAQSMPGRSAAGLAYEITGSGEPVVLIHGFTLDRHMWDPQVQAFATRYRLVAYDLRGHGDSAGAERPFTGYGDLLDLLDSLRIERATIIGLSAGSELAINFAIAHPQRVNRLVLASPGLGGYRGSALPWMQPVIDAITAGQPEEASRRWLQTPLMRLVTGVDAQPQVNQMVMRNAGLWMSKRVEQPLTPAAIGRLSEIRAPVLVVLGEEDQPHIRDIANVIVKGVSGAKLATIPGAAHLVNLDAPRMFNEVVGRFLSGR